jgi:hypothetical protein
MTSAPLRALGAALLAGLLLAAAPAASAATPATCEKLHGKDLAGSRAIRVVRLKLATIAPRGHNAGSEDRSGLFGCSLPNGPAHRLAADGRSYFKGQRNTPVESAIATVGTSAGRFVTVIETDDTLIGETFLTDRVVNAATPLHLPEHVFRPRVAVAGRADPDAAQPERDAGRSVSAAGSQRQPAHGPPRRVPHVQGSNTRHRRGREHPGRVDLT